MLSATRALIMKKFEVRNGEGFTVLESNHMYDCTIYVSEHPLSDGLTIQDNRLEMITHLNAISKELAKKIEKAGGANPSYEKMVDRIMSDPDNVWVDETDSVDLMNDYVILQQHVLDGVTDPKLPKRKLTNELNCCAIGNTDNNHENK